MLLCVGTDNEGVTNRHLAEKLRNPLRPCASHRDSRFFHDCNRKRVNLARTQASAVGCHKPLAQMSVQASAIWLRAELRVQRNKTLGVIFRALNEGHHVKHFATDLSRALVVSLGFEFCVVCNLRIFVSDRHASIAAHYQRTGVVGL